PSTEPAALDPTAALLAPRRRQRSGHSHRSSGKGSGSGNGAPSRARASSSSSSSRKRRSRTRMIVTLLASIGTALVILVVGLAVWLWQRPAPPSPIPAGTPEQMLAAQPTADWRWWRLESNTAILVLEFPSLLEQGTTMNRMAAYLEKRAGPRDRLLDDREMAELLKRSNDNVSTFYQGHDYTMDRVARFYTLADSTRTVLNGQELRLREALVRWGIIKQEVDRSYHSTAERALVSFTAVQADDPKTPEDEGIDARRRESVLRHELSHGEFFTNGDYRQQAWDFWRRSLTDNERQRFRRYLASVDYDAGNEELMVNETQAVLMHTPDTRAFSATDLGITDAELERLRERFRTTR
ncbi:hypothetical protein, partial [Pelomonas sp. KK5]|uniref:hypothetical protein n=1 Tax=Pelomonas sp. KK5 TaxID=1855730 RepID=UPI0018E91A45